MSKGEKTKIPLGSGHLYYEEFDATMKELTPQEIITAVVVAENRLGYIKNGASVEYKPTFVQEKDDLGVLMKEILTEEEATFKTGIFTWNGESLKALTSTARVTDDTTNGFRTVKIGGVKNDDGKKYCLVFHHVDTEEGDCWLIIVGRNTAGFTLAFKKDASTVIDAEFRCHPQDDEGTLITYVEEIEKAAQG